MPLDLETPAAETKQFAQMAAGEPVEAPASEPTPAPEPAPQPASEPTPAPAPEPKPAEPPADPAEQAKLARHVPFSAVLEERGKRKATQTELEAARAEIARLRGAPIPTPQPVEQPSAETDPIAIIQRLEREVGELRQGRQQEAQMGEFHRTVVTKEAEFLKDNPDYPKMVEFLKESRVRELRDGLGLTDAEIGPMLAQEAAHTARYALERDVNPAEIFARMAIAKGWKAEEPPKPAAPAPVERLETIAKGQRVAKGLSSGGGGAPSPVPTLESIAAMDGAEFDQMWKSGTVRKLMG